METAHKRDLVLDFWRGISVLFVILHHAVYFHFPIFRNWYSVALARGIFNSDIFLFANALLVMFSERAGPLGVRLFFIISGYIITKLLIEEEAKHGAISIKNFYIRRIFRILPPYFFYLFGVALFGALGWIAFSPQQLLNGFGFLCNMEFVDCSWSLIHSWTLSIEQQFYLLWPLLFLIVGKKYRIPFLVFTLGLLAAFSSTGFLLAHTWIDNANCFGCIALGALYASSTDFRLFMNKFGWLASILLIGMVGTMNMIDPLRDLAHILYRDITPFLLLTCIAASYSFTWVHKTKLFWFLAQIGLISYSLYLWQQLFLAPPEEYLTHSFLEFPILMFACALLSYLYIEKPFVAWAKRKTKTRIL